jgi:DNA-binding LacI/PurR family transcriptional regulator
MATNIRVREIARQLSVSPGTVSKTLRGSVGGVSVEKAKTVLGYCCEHGLIGKAEAGRILLKMKAQADGSQIFALTSRRGIMGYDAVLAGICQQIQSHGLYCSNFVVHEEEDLRQFPYDKAEGAIVLGRMDLDVLESLRQHDIPIVLVDNRLPAVRCGAVNSNNQDAVTRAVEMLVDMGHEHIAFLCLHERPESKLYYTFSQRQLGYLAGLANRDVPVDNRLMVTYCASGNQHTDFEPAKMMAHLAALTEKLLRLDPLPTAVIAVNDITAYFARKFITGKGLRVPQDMSIIGYDGWHRYSPMSNVGFTPTSTIVVDWQAMGRAAVDLALEMHCDTMSAPKYVEVPTEYEDLGTVAPPRTAVR